jgi:hypothetical protein
MPFSYLVVVLDHPTTHTNTYHSVRSTSNQKCKPETRGANVMMKSGAWFGKSDGQRKILLTRLPPLRHQKAKTVKSPARGLQHPAETCRILSFSDVCPEPVLQANSPVFSVNWRQKDVATHHRDEVNELREASLQPRTCPLLPRADVNRCAILALAV